MKRILTMLAALLLMAAPALAAPLFPDVPENHWARDAVSALAAKGVLEGYPDGTFKGDRASTRWEVAAVVARLLARMEEDHTSLATATELQEIRRLAESLREELDAMGVRVTSLEGVVERLDRRVGELERITFYGEVTTRVGGQSFRATGSSALGGGIPLLDYNSAVGSATGAGGPIPAPSAAAGMAMNPFVFGILSVTDWRSGRPLTNGAMFTTRALLGTRVRLAEDVDAGVEFTAYTSQGDHAVDQYWGVTPPGLSNPFTGITTITGGLAGAQSQNHIPYTRMNLDNFWVKHNPSKTSLVLGSFRDVHFDEMVYVQEVNPNYYGPKWLDSFGIKVDGEVALTPAEDVLLRWEAMGARLADGNVSPIVADASYFTHTEGVNAAILFHDERGEVRFNFLHTANDASGGRALSVGLIQAPNFTLNWVNPNGYFFNQLGGPNLATAGIGSTSDVRPIPMFSAVNNDGVVGVAGVPNVGGLGPQDMTTWGLSASYVFDQAWDPRLFIEWAHSEYRPQKNSAYSVGGDALRAGIGASFLERSLDVDLHYLSVDPTYDPFVLQLPTIDGIGTVLWRTPGFTYYDSLYSLHDTEIYTHNRQGWRGEVTWKFGPTGRVTANYGLLDQVETSMQDVRYSANSLAPGTPNTPVLGFSPGFMDPVFGGFAASTYAPAGGNALAVPLENPRGHVTNWGLAAGYKFLLEEGENNRGILISGGARSTHFTRNSNLQALLPGPGGTRGESQNNVDLFVDGWRAAVEYDVTETFRIHGGYTAVDIYGHFDPLGNLSAYAEATGLTRFDSLNMEQRYPDLGFDWDLAENLTWGMEGKYYQTKDRISSNLFPTPGIPNLNLNYGPEGNAHPFNWEGWQVHSYFNFKF